MTNQGLKNVSRRDFLKLLGLAAAATKVSACGPLSSGVYSPGDAIVPQSLKIDTHQHYVPPSYAAWLDEHDIRPGGVTVPAWDKTAAIKMMDQQGIAVGMLSLSTPGVHLGDVQAARRMAREVNEFAAEVVASGSRRFGFFATLTLPDVDGALLELQYALDQLHADGVILLANSRGTYLGNASFEPLMAELNRRRGVVFVHPAELPGTAVPGIPPFAADFLLDTTRAALNLYLSGALLRYPEIRFILAHGGGFVPYAVFRLVLSKLQRGNPSSAAPMGFDPMLFMDSELAQFRRLYFDTALTSSPTALPSLLSLAGAEHVTYGSDWPFAPESLISLFDSQLESYSLEDAQRVAIEHRTAATLFPHLALSGG